MRAIEESKAYHVGCLLIEARGNKLQSAGDLPGPGTAGARAE